MTPALRRHILPPQSTPLERAVDQAVPDWGWMADCVSPAWVSRDPQFAPWLAVDWQVAQFAPYFDDVPALLAAGLPWLRLRGSPAGLRAALGWLGYQSITIDEDAAWLHLDLGRLVSDDELRPVAHVARASIPAHVKFYRVFHDWDLRPARLDASRLDDALLDDDSGIFVAVDPYGAPVKLSQGVTRARAADAPRAGGAQGASTRVFISIATYDDRPVLDAWRLDSAVLQDASGGATHLFTALSNAPDVPPPLWLKPAQVVSRQCAWDAPAPAAARTHTRAGAAPRPHDARTWATPGAGWSARPWRLNFPSNHYTTTDPEEG